MITHLSPSQEQELVAWREQWYAIGSACGPSDRETTTRLIAAVYRAIGKPAPAMHFVESPAAALSHLLEEKDSLTNPLSMRRQLWTALWLQIWPSLKEAHAWALKREVENILWEALWLWLMRLVDEKQIQILKQRLSQEQAQAQMFSQPLVFYGNHDAYWIAYYLFCKRLGVQYTLHATKCLDWWASLARSCGWWWPYERVCIVADRPSVHHVDEQRRLHCTTGPAMIFHDGYALWAWHGVLVSKPIIEQLSLSSLRLADQAGIEAVVS